jgi:EAL domain-containing protein (putative c-di-GMP-specific phosphodiesterase class I)
LAVNVSGRHLEEPEFPEAVATILTESGLTPGLLCIEITESVFLADAPRVHRQLAMLDELGVALAVDDFGTGYSSLRYLKRFPVDILKVDRSFVSEIDRSPRDRAIVEAVISLAHALGLSVVAEGVETARQLASLRALRCELGQGYFWSEPLSDADIRAFLRARLVSIGSV